jgi:catechol 2,3-dioxygenase-like lactoylglutathione lyase family enzyme
LTRATKRNAKIKPAAVDFNHAMIYVRELQPALHFYVDLLGLILVEQEQPGYARLRSTYSGTTIALHTLGNEQSVPEEDSIRLYFEVSNLGKLLKKLETAGVRFTQHLRRMPWGWKQAFVADPDGHELCLYWAGVQRVRAKRLSR